MEKPSKRTITIGHAPTPTGLTQIVSAPKPPEYADKTNYDDYRGDFRFYMRSIEPVTRGQILAALAGLMAAWKEKKKSFIRNVDPETFLRPEIGDPSSLKMYLLIPSPRI
jgi:hypothetical protein